MKVLRALLLSVLTVALLGAEPPSPPEHPTPHRGRLYRGDQIPVGQLAILRSTFPDAAPEWHGLVGKWFYKEGPTRIRLLGGQGFPPGGPSWETGTKCRYSLESLWEVPPAGPLSVPLTQP